MAARTSIQWADHTWSPWRGCQKVSDGCKFCYAEALARRNPAVLGEWGPNSRRVVNKDWDAPRRWDRDAARSGVRRRVFPSMCDWLEDRLELADVRARFLRLIEETPNLDWLLLTKRPENFILVHGMSSNVWLGVSVEDQATADERIPILLETPAALRWVSYEPALGPVDFTPWLEEVWSHGFDPEVSGYVIPRLDWIVVGGESGPHARPFDVAWALKTIADCREAGVPCCVKQLGADPIEQLDCGGVIELDLAHPKGGDPSEWSLDLWVREMPASAGGINA